MQTARKIQGAVLAVFDDSIEVLLRDPDSNAEFDALVPLALVAEEDAPLVREGAYFDMSLQEDGQVAGITFMRETWTAEELEQSRAEAENLAKNLRWD